MSTPRVTEIHPVHAPAGRDDFADEPLRRPRMAPYDRAAERRMVLESLNAILHTHTYDRESPR